MKTGIRFLVLTLIGLTGLGGLHVYAQSSVDVPETINMANLELHLTDRYRDSIRIHAEALMRNNKYFRLTVERGDAYFTIVERVLSEEQVPDDMKYLVLQESKLVSDVVSGSNAVGYWQFKKETAIEMGLKVNDDVDERMNIVASTHAAGRYLRRHNAYMNNWIYSVLAYYAGLGGARQIIDKSMIGSAKMDLDINTHWYITKFLAHKMAYETALHRNPSPPLMVSEYTECENKTLEEIAISTNVPLEDLAFYNKWVRKGHIPGDKDYTVVLPMKATDSPLYMAMVNKPEPCTNKDLQPYRKSYFFGLIKGEPVKPEDCAAAAAVAASEAAGANTTASAKEAGEYKSQAPLFFSWNGIKAILARRSDNIARLALQADIDKEDFLDYNDMRIFDQIVPGQVYYIKAKKKKAKVPYHTVREGETLWEISQNYGIRMVQLLKKNRMDRPEKLKAGRILWLRHTRPENMAPEYAPVPKPAPTPSPAVIPAPQVEPRPDSSLAKKQDTQTEPATQAGNALTAATAPDLKPASAPAENPYAIPVTGNGASPVSAEVNNAISARPSLPASSRADSAAVTITDVDDKDDTTGEKNIRIFTGLPEQKVETPKTAETPKTEIKAAPDTEKAISSLPVAVPAEVGKKIEEKSEPAKPAVASTDRPGFEKIILEPGQTLYGLSKSLNVHIDSLRGWNSLESRGLQMGMALYYRQPAPEQPEKPADGERKSASVTELITVIKPETKPIVNPEIKTGQKPEPKTEQNAEQKPVKTELKPEVKPTPTKDPLAQKANSGTKIEEKPVTPSQLSGGSYVVKPGDTMYRIARENGVSVKQLQEWNNKPSATVSVGETIKILK